MRWLKFCAVILCASGALALGEDDHGSGIRRAVADPGYSTGSSTDQTARFLQMVSPCVAGRGNQIANLPPQSLGASTNTSPAGVDPTAGLFEAQLPSLNGADLLSGAGSPVPLGSSETAPPAKNQTGGDLVRGMQLFASKNCTGCHGTKKGSAFQSLVSGAKKVPGRMTSVFGSLSGQDKQDILKYLQSVNP